MSRKLCNVKINVLRGLHYQREPYSQSKLVYVSKGKILDIAVDMRKIPKHMESTFQSYYQKEENNELFIPKGLLMDILL